jgi:hypothetical protein
VTQPPQALRQPAQLLVGEAAVRRGHGLGAQNELHEVGFQEISLL